MPCILKDLVRILTVSFNPLSNVTVSNLRKGSALINIQFETDKFVRIHRNLIPSMFLFEKFRM